MICFSDSESFIHRYRSSSHLLLYTVVEKDHRTSKKSVVHHHWRRHIDTIHSDQKRRSSSHKVAGPLAPFITLDSQVYTHPLALGPNQAKPSASTPVPSSHQPHCLPRPPRALASSSPPEVPSRAARGPHTGGRTQRPEKSRQLLVTPTLNGFAVWPARVSAFVALPEVKRSKSRSCMVEARAASIQTHVGGC